MKKNAIRLGVFLVSTLILFGVLYDAYSHYMITQLYQYIDAGDEDKAIECIEKMPNVNTLQMCLPLYCIARTCTGGASMTGYPLYYAISHKADISIINALLEKGADPNRIDLGFEGHYPLYYICMNPSKDMYEKTVLLVDHGANINTSHIYISEYFVEFSEEIKESMFSTIIYLWETERKNGGT